MTHDESWQRTTTGLVFLSDSRRAENALGVRWICRNKTKNKTKNDATALLSSLTVPASTVHTEQRVVRMMDSKERE